MKNKKSCQTISTKKLTSPHCCRMFHSDLLKDLHQRSNTQGLIKSVSVVASYLLLVVIGIKANNLVIWFLLWPMAGFVLSGFFSAVHYSTHGTLYKNRRLNRWLGLTWSLPIFLNASLYKYFHAEHHRHANVSGDTEPAGAIKNIGYYLFFCLNWDFIYAFLRMSILSLINRYPFFIKSNVARKEVRQDTWSLFFWFLLSVLLTWFFPKAMAFTYWIPLQCAWIFNYICSLPEHYNCATNQDGYANTRTMKPNALFQYFYWNSNYHAEHHIYPSIPFYNLGKIHTLISDHQQHCETSYLRFHWQAIKTLLLLPKDNPVSASAAEGRFYSFAYPTYQHSGEMHDTHLLGR